ncbi:hypothetical protein F8388_000251 [Cannabis sativa]|uniref:Photosystem I assembly protein Ycf3 n=1 Tax=Cannabis sativa TaxID=3483 RepID=A0A7J6DR52_CANSA|nr:hypothetical protein F8388_000251 [Cannabis sativa]
MSAQSEGNYAEALQNYYEAMRLEIDPYDRSYILYNIGLIHTRNGEHTKALEYYFRALERNPFLPQAFNNMAVICHYSGSPKVLSSGVASDPKDTKFKFETHNLFLLVNSRKKKWDKSMKNPIQFDKGTPKELDC